MAIAGRICMSSGIALHGVGIGWDGTADLLDWIIRRLCGTSTSGVHGFT